MSTFPASSVTKERYESEPWVRKWVDRAVKRGEMNYCPWRRVFVWKCIDLLSTSLTPQVYTVSWPIITETFDAPGHHGVMGTAG